MDLFAVAAFMGHVAASLPEHMFRCISVLGSGVPFWDFGGLFYSGTMC